MAKKSKKSSSKKSRKPAARKTAPKKKVTQKKKVARPAKKVAAKKSVKKSAKKASAIKPARPKAAVAKQTSRPAPQTTQAVTKPAVVYPTRIADRSVQLTDGKTVQLSSLVGSSGLVLYFYPKDDTPGCTVEACNFRDTESALTSKGWNVVGVSPDSAAAHQKFTSKHQLNFPLIADQDHSLCEAAHVWQEKSMYGKSYMGVARTTFLLDSNLNVKKVYERVRPDGHAGEILKDVS